MPFPHRWQVEQEPGVRTGAKRGRRVRDSGRKREGGREPWPDPNPTFYSRYLVTLLGFFCSEILETLTSCSHNYIPSM